MTGSSLFNRQLSFFQCESYYIVSLLGVGSLPGSSVGRVEGKLKSMDF